MQANCPQNGQHNFSNENETLRRENKELVGRLQAFEHESVVNTKKMQAYEKELNRLIKQNHELIYALDYEREQKLKLIQNSQEIKNQLSLQGAEMHKYESLSKILTQENETLKAQVQAVSLEKVALLKQKQNACNMLLVSQSRLEASKMQESFLNTSLVQLTTQKFKLQQEVRTLNKRLSENSGAYVKTVLKDNNQTTKQLLSEFEQKIYSKEMANSQQILKYETKVAQLNRKVAELESVLASK